MMPLTLQVRQLLAARGHVFLGQAAPPRAVDVRRNCTAVVASLAFADGRRRLVVKAVAAGDVGLGTPERLYAVHEAVRARSPALAERTPRFLGIDAERRLVVMEYVPGATLLARLRGHLRLFGSPAGPAEPPLRQAAGLLAELHRLPAADAGLADRPSPNGAFLPDFEASWNALAVRRLLPPRYHDPQRLFDHLPSAFAGRAEGRLLLVDTQPKNMLVDDAGRVYFIDLDYSAGNPAIGLAQFLVGLDRLGLRHPLARPGPQVAAWKRCFLDAYGAQAPPSVAEDLVFFYPWVLLQILRQHAAGHPWLRWYLSAHYGRRLREFLANLDRLPASDVARRPAALFADP